ncbi:Aste57867_21009 [Aphanomyces stellatus]|uniref:Aste57867_21009 protein n=1 Tax=Aphanomyces stellatus TaxID=120398 RepID=A0A485LH54_9STRA|nr:hypothetical protein As57867_020941 [Aphanomyces stellatus]VFT97684.1 Aste57867_21009 [Aphanomyces stellatus]
MLARVIRREAAGGIFRSPLVAFSSHADVHHVKQPVPSASNSRHDTEAVTIKKELAAWKATIDRDPHSLSPSSWHGIAQTLVKCRSLQLSQAAQSLVSKPALLESPVGSVHNEVIRIMLNLHRLDDVIAMARSGKLPLTNRTLSRVLGACARSSSSKISEAFELFDLAVAQGTVPHMSAYHSLFLLCSKDDDHARLEYVKNHMVDAGVPWDATCHGLFMRMDARAGNIDGAIARYQRLKADGLTLPVNHLNDFLGMLEEAGRVDDAVQIFDAIHATMPDKEWGAGPTSVDDAIKLPLNVISYNIMIKMSGKAARMDQAFKWYEGLKAKGLTPTTITINTMLHGVYHGKYRSIDSDAVYMGLAGVGAVAGATLYAIDLSESMGAVALTSSIMASLAVGIYVNPHGVKKSIYPNESGPHEPVPQAILRRLDEEEHIGRLMYLWTELLGYGLHPDTGTFDILVRTCIRKRHPELAANVLLDGVNPNSIAARRKAKGAKYQFELGLDSTVRLVQALISQNLLPLLHQIFDLAASTHRFQELVKKSPGSGGALRHALGIFQTPKVTAIVLAKFLAPLLKTPTPPRHPIVFEVQNCYAVLDALDTINPLLRGLFVMEDVHGTGHGHGALVVNPQRLDQYFATGRQHRQLPTA